MKIYLVTRMGLDPEYAWHTAFVYAESSDEVLDILGEAPEEFEKIEEIGTAKHAFDENDNRNIGLKYAFRED